MNADVLVSQHQKWIQYYLQKQQSISQDEVEISSGPYHPNLHEQFRNYELQSLYTNKP